jgi:type IV secretory pathway TraG/TraD family ATPase VirD4
VEPLDYLGDVEEDELFSIEKWMKSEGDGWLFLSSSLPHRAASRPLLAARLSIAMRSLMKLEPSLDRRVWFVVDELPALGKVKDLEMLVCEGRKFGACALLAMQSPAQIEAIYGRQSARTIFGNCLRKCDKIS